ncbi:hypothetical protein B0H66DRAFT_546060 [Apodospora peruviana]|uniref:Uncharacterized protein n=1 Tax=Apodospora peruviana TaxID=516989 RepID=A0AAE0MGT7_9PEZI|nr:hypothetical protein B0H66DRAFT_546060 [Apodospora peruviana]
MPADGTVDLQPLFFSLTMDVASALLFGRSVYSLRADIDQAAENRDFANNFNIAQEGLAKRFRLAPFHSVYNSASFRQECRSVHQFVERYIRETGLMQRGGDFKDLDEEDNASRFFQQVGQESATEAEVRDQLLDVFRLLVRRPPVMDRLRREVVSVMGDTAIPTREKFERCRSWPAL